MRGPVDIIGLPRTGTTALANMMSLDPQFRCLRGWEQSQPLPPPRPETDATDPRRMRLAEENEHLSPELKAMHLYDLDATMEDSEVLGMAFHGQQYTLPVYGYHDWWRRADLTETYAYHRRVVQLLQSEHPPDLWLFKAPHHKFHLEPIVAAYPDVRFVMTHRDPAKSVPSYSSLVSTIFPPSTGERDLHRVGHEVSEHLRIGMENAIAARARIGEDRFLDVHHRELVGDPLGTLARVYDFCGLELTPATEQAVLRLAGGQPHRRPRHPPLHGRAVRPEHRLSSTPTTRSTPTTSASSSRADRPRPGPARRTDREHHPTALATTRRTTMTDADAPQGLPSWADQLKALEPVVDRLLATWRPDGATAAEVQDMNKLALSILSEGYLCRVYTDASRPVFMPLWNYAYNQGGPSPDYVYSTTEVDARGVYRISGYRGTVRFVEITQQTFDMMSPSQVDHGSRVPATHDLDSLALEHGEVDPLHASACRRSPARTSRSPGRRRSRRGSRGTCRRRRTPGSSRRRGRRSSGYDFPSASE